MARIAGDATDKRRRLWQMRLPAVLAAYIGAAAIWILLLRQHVPEAERGLADAIFFLVYFIGIEALRLGVRWRLDSRIARARQVIVQPMERASGAGGEPFEPAHVLTVDGAMVAAIDPERRLVRVIAPVFLGLDVIFRVDARIRRVRLTKPKLVDLPAVAGMPKVTSDIHRASALTIHVDRAAEPALFFVADEDLPAAIEWTNVLQRWMQEDIGWDRNAGPASVESRRADVGSP